MNRVIQRYGLDNPDFSPLLLKMIEDLESHPKSFPKKQGRLADARAYRLRYRGAAWRAVYLVIDELQEVEVLSLAPHDEAYAQAERRV